MLLGTIIGIIFYVYFIFSRELIKLFVEEKVLKF
ncbi:hypothetical protein BHO_0900005 [Borrelia hermsii YBT]|nr:hypothetical protein BHO_0900005 [Borrelia hermsii YBT]